MKKLTLLLALTMILFSCKPEAEKPTVTTKSVGEVTETTAKVVGQVTADGGAEVTERGVCWNTIGAPEVIDYRTVDGTGVGTFNSNISDLVPNTQYYVRTYATNEKGVSYGEEMTFTTKKEIELPEVKTAEVEDITESEAVSGGEVISDGGAEVTARGICWSTSQTPTIEDNKTTDGSGVGSFTSNLSNLEPQTTYYVRAYATNEKGTAYGEKVSFTTEEVEEPENPENPENPEQPEDPENPEQPEDPETPEQPEDPETPEQPEDPENPEQPEDPENPENPEQPEDPETPIEPEQPVGPVVITAEVTEIALYSAKCGGGVSDGGGAVVVERGVCWNTSGNPTVLDFTTKDGSGLGSYISNITGLEHGTTYYVRAYAANANGVAGYGKEVSFTTLEKLLPTVTTAAEVTEITFSSAVCGGEVTFDGNVSVTARGICWSTTQTPTIEDNKTTNGEGVGSYTSNMTGLEHGTTYYVRAYATNEVGTAYGEEVSFTTIEKLLPTVTTATEVTNITVSSATCGGEVTFEGNVKVTARGICWSTTQNPTIEDNKTTNGNGVGTFTSKMTNLEHNTTYYVRAYATNEVGTAYGEEVSFTTLEKLLPTVTTATEVTDITVSSAVCGGEVTSDGDGKISARGICWNTTGNPTIEDSKTTNGEGIGSYTSNMTNLKHGTTYYVRAYATNEVGTAYGEEVNFTTIEKLLPTVTTATEVTNITVSSATCGGEVTFNGNVEVTSRGICWSTTQNPTIEDNKTSNGSVVGSYTSNMTNLEHNTTYYVRAYATNEVGTAYGEEVTFTTLEKLLPTVTTATEVTDITAGSATCGGEVTFNGNVEVTSRGICWSTSQNPTIEDNKTTNGSGVGSYTSKMTNLEPHTTYYVRAYATNEVGTAYGEERTFKTFAYSPATGTSNGYGYVDLGLSVKWATCNVGATSPEEYGDYFAWGETSPKDEYPEDYCSTYGKQMNNISGNPQYDAATANWGGNWRMPKYGELNELRTKCTWTRISQNGVNGYNVEGPNGNSIFLPAAGIRIESSLGSAGREGNYWSSSPGEYSVDYSAYNLYFSWGDPSMDSAARRTYGRSVRPVRK